MARVGKSCKLLISIGIVGSVGRLGVGMEAASSYG